jgi:hypothetical protein
VGKLLCVDQIAIAVSETRVDVDDLRSGLPYKVGDHLITTIITMTIQLLDFGKEYTNY